MNSRIRLLCAQLMNAAHDIERAAGTNEAAQGVMRAREALSLLARAVSDQVLSEDPSTVSPDNHGAPHVTAG